MKLLLLCILMVGTSFFVFKNKSVVAPPQFLRTPHSPSVLSDDTISFILQIQPVLVSHCSPCHFTGGKMYEKLPFDKGETIVDHGVALLRRIKDDKEKGLIQKFIGEHK